MPPIALQDVPRTRAITVCEKCGKIAAAYRRRSLEKALLFATLPTTGKACAQRIKAIAYLGGRCVNCGSTNDLQFDHREPGTRRFSITERIGGRWSTIEAELVKCQLLCFECHARKHEAECPQAGSVNSRRRALAQGATTCSLISIS